MLRVRSTKRRGGFTLDVNFEQTTRALGVFGPSGSGKSTLLHLIAGIERPEDGRIVLDDRVLFDGAAQIHVPMHARRIGMMFQDDRLFPHLSVEQNLRFGERLVPMRERRFDVRAVADALKLEHLLRRRVWNLSGGERQRIALGRALLCSPKLLLFDEPLSSLDLSLKLEIMPFLRAALEQFPIPMVYVSHDLTELLQLTDELLVIRDGRVIDQGRYLALTRNAGVLDAIHLEGLMNVLPATVVNHDVAAGMTNLSLSSNAEAVLNGNAIGGFSVPLQTCPIGAVVQVVIRPEDVSLANARIQGISIQNQREGKIVRCTAHGGRALVEIDMGRNLLALVSKRTVESMELAPGKPVWCLIKSSAIQVR